MHEWIQMVADDYFYGMCFVHSSYLCVGFEMETAAKAVCVHM